MQSNKEDIDNIPYNGDGVEPDNYVLPEDDAQPLARMGVDDVSPDSCVLQEEDNPEENGEEDSHDNDEEPEEKGKNPFGMMIRTLLTPIEGWKEIRRSKITAESFASGCFYPLVAVASGAEFIRLLYGEYVSVSTLVVRALVAFLSFFLGYFGSQVVARLVLPNGAKIIDGNFGKVFIMNAMSTLALFSALTTAFPMVEPILVFLPLWTIYLICRGARFLKLNKNKQTSSTSILCLLIIGMPILMGWILSEILPIG